MWRVSMAHVSCMPEQQRLLAGAATLSIDGLRCDRQAANPPIERGKHWRWAQSPYRCDRSTPDLARGDSRTIALERSSTNQARLTSKGALDPAAVRFGVVLGDKHGQPVDFHDIARARQILSDTTIPLAQPARFSIRCRHRNRPSSTLRPSSCTSLCHRTLSITLSARICDLSARPWQAP